MLFKYATIVLAKLFFLCNFDLLVNKNKVVVLMYHGVGGVRTLKGSAENYDGKQVFVEKFEKQLQYLRGRYCFVALKDFCEFLEGKKKLPKNSVLLTFDDGYMNNFEILFPVLKKYNIPAAIFVCPGLIGKKRPNWPDLVEWSVVQSEKKEIVVAGSVFSLALDKRKESIIGIKNVLFKFPSFEREKMVENLLKNLEMKEDFSDNYRLMDWDEIKNMNGLVSFGSHSLTHPILPIEPLEKIREEVGVSKNSIEKNLGEKVCSFAYPNGIFDEKTKELVCEASYSCAFAVRWGKVDRKSDRFALARIPVNGNDSAEFFFLNLIVDAHKLVHVMRGLL